MLFEAKPVVLASIELEGNVHVTSDVLRERVEATRASDIDDDTLARRIFPA